jgi:hypothetical protein
MIKFDEKSSRFGEKTMFLYLGQNSLQFQHNFVKKFKTVILKHFWELNVGETIPVIV